MTPRLRGDTDRRQYRVSEAAALTGLTPGAIRKRIRTGAVAARDLNAGTGKRPNWRIPAREVEQLRGGV